MCAHKMFLERCEKRNSHNIKLKSQQKAKSEEFFFPHKSKTKRFRCEHSALPNSSCSFTSWGSEPLRLRHSLYILALRVTISSSVASPLSPWEQKAYHGSWTILLSPKALFSSGGFLFSDLGPSILSHLVRPVKGYAKAAQVTSGHFIQCALQCEAVSPKKRRLKKTPTLQESLGTDTIRSNEVL